jgi:hypothetical protein
MSKTLRTIALVVSVTFLIYGCSTDKYKNCPSASAIVDTTIATVFKTGATADPANILYTVEVTGVTAICDVDKQALNSDSSVEISFRATRAPNGAAVSYQVPYFVAISQSDRLLAKRVYVANFSFEPGETSTTFSQSVGSVDVSAGKDKKTFDYVILAGIQLTKEQLQYNRATGRLNP